MSEQLSFITLGGKEVVLPSVTKAKKGQAKGWAAYPGSGPKGEFCKTCSHARGIRIRSGKTFWKCDLVKATGGPGTDIRLKWPACAKWEAKIISDSSPTLKAN